MAQNAASYLCDDNLPSPFLSQQLDSLVLKGCVRTDLSLRLCPRWSWVSQSSKAHITSGFAPMPRCFPGHVALAQSRDHLPLTGPCFVTKECSLDRLVLQLLSVAVTNITTQTVEEETVVSPCLSRSQSATEGGQGGGSSRGGKLGGHCFLACSLTGSCSPSFLRNQELCLGSCITHRGLDPPTSVNS